MDGVTLTGGAVCPGACGTAPAGSDCFAGVLRSSTVGLAPAFRVPRIDSASDVHMNAIAEIVVAFDNSVAEPRGPNAVCEPMPPKAPARSAAFPLCNRTTMIRNRQTRTWMIVKSINMMKFQYKKPAFTRSNRLPGAVLQSPIK
jgi:hypothetical protein